MCGEPGLECKINRLWIPTWHGTCYTRTVPTFATAKLNKLYLGIAIFMPKKVAQDLRIIKSSPAIHKLLALDRRIGMWYTANKEDRMDELKKLICGFFFFWVTMVLCIAAILWGGDHF